MDRGATESTLLINLGGRTVSCRFARRRRRTIGITVDAAGVAVAAPLRARWQEIDGFVRSKERWIVRKLDEWARLPRPSVLHGAAGESFPLYGIPVTLARAVPLKKLVAWLKALALDALTARAAHFSRQLGVPSPRVSLSSARTQWGTCTEGGAIRLNWRLVHLDPGLADYVVAHEVAHLVELNHSKRFWSQLAAIYPDWRAARKRLEAADASLPILRTP
jgi:predicted metal-dependent hydrolase